MTIIFRKKGDTIFGIGNSPLAGGKVHYYIAGTTTRQDTYADQAGSVINDNPIILDADGDFPTNVYLGTANNYKEVIEASDSSFSMTNDDIPKDATPQTTLLVQSPSLPWTTLSATSTILDENDVGKAFAANTQNNDVTIYLPDPALAQNGPTLAFKKIHATNSLILLTHTGGAFLTISNNGDSAWISSNGSSWYVMADLNSSSGGGLADNSVTNAKLADVASGTFKGRIASGSGDPQDLNSVDATSLLNGFTPDNGTVVGLKGLVPAPQVGDAAASKVLSADGTWSTPSGGGSTSLNPATGDLVGINTTADTTNRLSLNAPASLFNHDGTDHQLKINKNAAANNSSVLFQTGFSGRAELGLTGDDDFHMKVSPDGTTFHEGIVIDKDTGACTFPNTTLSDGTASSILQVKTFSDPTDYTRTGNSYANMGASFTVSPISTTSSLIVMWCADLGITAGSADDLGFLVFPHYYNSSDSTYYAVGIPMRQNLINIASSTGQSAYFGNSSILILGPGDNFKSSGNWSMRLKGKETYSGTGTIYNQTAIAFEVEL